MSGKLAEKVKACPTWFQWYLGEQHESISRNNQCEHRPTYQDQIDRETERCLALYHNGQEWLKTVSDEDVYRCGEITELIHGRIYYTGRYMECKIANKWVLVPARFAKYELYLKIKEVFNVNAKS